MEKSKAKIWNKVVRLAEKSEFKIETTSSISGVRGTEFGFDGDTLIVKSGIVDIYNLDETTVLRTVEAGPDDPRKVTFGAGGLPGIPEPADEASFREFYSVLYLNSGMKPRVLEVKKDTMTVENIYKTLNKNPDLVNLAGNRLYLEYDGGELPVTFPDLENGGKDYTIPIPFDGAPMLTGVRMRFEQVINNEALYLTAWSSPVLTLRKNAGMSYEDLNPTDTRPKLTVTGPSLVVAPKNTGSVDYALTMNLTNADFTQAVQPEYQVADDGGDFTCLTAVASGSFQKSPFIVNLTAALPAGGISSVSYCKLRVTVENLPEGTILEEFVSLKFVPESGGANPSVTGFLPGLTGLSTIVHQAQKQVVLSWDLQMNGHNFQSLSILNEAGNPLPLLQPTASLTENDKEAVLSADNFTVGETMVIKLELKYRHDKVNNGEVQTLTAQTTITLSPPTILSYKIITPASPVPSDIAAGVPVKAVITKTTANPAVSETDPMADISSFCTWSAQYGTVDKTAGLYTPSAAVTADTKDTVTCTLPQAGSQVGPYLTSSFNKAGGTVMLLAAVTPGCPAGTVEDTADGSCWVLANEGQNCTDACSLGTTSTPELATAGLTCADPATNWNDINGAACNSLTQGNTGFSANIGAAPYYLLGPNRCYSRNISFSYTPPENVCNAPSVTGQPRICKCN